MPNWRGRSARRTVTALGLPLSRPQLAVFVRAKSKSVALVRHYQRVRLATGRPHNFVALQEAYEKSDASDAQPAGRSNHFCCLRSVRGRSAATYNGTSTAP